MNPANPMRFRIQMMFPSEIRHVRKALRGRPDIFPIPVSCSRLRRPPVRVYQILQEDRKWIIHFTNHPSGVLDPSPDDLEVTQRLRKAGDIIGIEIIDHIIFGFGGYRSMYEHGELL